MVASAIAGGLGLVGSIIGSKSSGDAADAQIAASQQAAAVQREQLAVATDIYQQGRLDQYPSLVIGRSAQNALADALGVPRLADESFVTGDFGPFSVTNFLNNVEPGTRSGTGGGAQAQSSVTAPNGSNFQFDPARGEYFFEVQNPTGGGGANAGTERGDFLASQPPTFRRQYVGAEIPGLPGSDPTATAQNALAGQAAPPATNALTESLGFQQTPGFEFAASEARKEVERAASARGLNLSGAAISASGDRIQGLQNQEYNNYLNRLTGLAGGTQPAINSLAASGANFQGAGAGAAGNIGNALLAGGDARALGAIGQGNALQGGLTAIGNAAGDFFGRQDTTNPLGSGSNSFGFNDFTLSNNLGGLGF